MDDGDWERLEEAARQNTHAGLVRVVRVLKVLDESVTTRLNDVHDTLARLDENLHRVDEAVKEAQSRWQLDRRQAALQAAREHVSLLPSEQPGARGYRDAAFPPDKRLEHELRVARYLLGGEG